MRRLLVKRGIIKVSPSFWKILCHKLEGLAFIGFFNKLHNRIRLIMK